MISSWTNVTCNYVQIKLCKEGQSVFKYVHRLVAEAFIPNPDNLPEVDHIDGNKSNNAVANLRWVTRSTNIRARNGVEYIDDREVISAYLSGISLRKVAIKFGTYHPTVRRILDVHNIPLRSKIVSSS